MSNGCKNESWTAPTQPSTAEKCSVGPVLDAFPIAQDCQASLKSGCCRTWRQALNNCNRDGEKDEGSSFGAADLISMKRPTLHFPSNTSLMPSDLLGFGLPLQISLACSTGRSCAQIIVAGTSVTASLAARRSSDLSMLSSTSPWDTRRRSRKLYLHGIPRRIKAQGSEMQMQCPA